MSAIRTLGLISLLFMVIACAREQNIQGEWFYDYAQTKMTEFPNSYYESARDLITDVEPKYGQINVDNSTVLLGGAVCKIHRINDSQGLDCDERGQKSSHGIYYENDYLIVKTSTNPSNTLIFSRKQHNPYQVYGIDPVSQSAIENTDQTLKVAIPGEDSNSMPQLKGLARTASFDAFYDKSSLKNEGRYSSVIMVLNYSNPPTSGPTGDEALSSVQYLTFDCPASNYRIDRFLMHKDMNGQGAVISDSENSAITNDWKPVPENSVNKLMYMQACQK
jgi:hypothetical protein